MAHLKFRPGALVQAPHNLIRNSAQLLVVQRCICAAQTNGNTRNWVHAEMSIRSDIHNVTADEIQQKITNCLGERHACGFRCGPGALKELGLDVDMQTSVLACFHVVCLLHILAFLSFQSVSMSADIWHSLMPSRTCPKLSSMFRSRGWSSTL